VWTKGRTLDRVADRPAHVYQTGLILAKGWPGYYHLPALTNNSDIWNIATDQPDCKWATIVSGLCPAV
jgi:hypothetical protein